MGRVVHFEIHADNPQRAIAFYKGLFGWEITKWDGPMDYWTIHTGPKEQPGIDGGMVPRRGTLDGTAVIAYVCTVDVADIDAGGQGADPTYICLAPGMPRSMIVYHPMEIVVTQDATFVLIDHIHDSRRIYTDGRDWPDEVDPAFAGYSMGRWIDTDLDGRYDVLEVETRHMKGPRTFDATGIPLLRI